MGLISIGVAGRTFSGGVGLFEDLSLANMFYEERHEEAGKTGADFISLSLKEN